jgi:epoxide hydrolase-like predicted phosphatase
MIDTIFFDWAGVMATDPGDDFLSNLFKKIGADDTQIEDIFKTYMSKLTRGRISVDDFWSELHIAYGFSIPENISDEFKKWKGLVANTDILALVDCLKTSGLNVALLTNVIEPSYDVIKDARYYDYFDAVIASCKVGYGKPDKQIYDIALIKMDTIAERSLFIDDKQSFLDPAIKMGFTTILAVSPEQIIRDVLNQLHLSLV